MKKIVVFILYIGLSGCTSLAPLSNTPTARTLGKGNVHIGGGYVIVADNAHVRTGFGITDEIDLFFLAESGILNDNAGIALKYGLLKADEGLSASLDGSLGTTKEKYYFYIGPTLSYKKNWIEPFVVARYNYAQDKYKEIDLFNINESDSFMTTRLHYGQLTGGATIWVNNHFGLNLHVDQIFGDGDGTVFGAGFHWRS